MEEVKGLYENALGFYRKAVGGSGSGGGDGVVLERIKEVEKIVKINK